MEDRGVKRFLTNPNTWIQAIVVGLVITPLTTGIVDIIKKRNFFHTIWNLLVKIASFVWDFLMMDLKFYQLIVILLMIWGIKKVKSKSKIEVIEEPEENPIYDFLTYRKDKFGWGIEWIWSYEFSNYSKKYIPVKMIPLCNKCETTMTLFNGDGNCPRCMNKIELYHRVAPFALDNEIYLDDTDSIQIMVKDNIRKREFRDWDKCL